MTAILVRRYIVDRGESSYQHFKVTADWANVASLLLNLSYLTASFLLRPLGLMGPFMTTSLMDVCC